MDSSGRKFSSGGSGKVRIDYHNVHWDLYLCGLRRCADSTTLLPRRLLPAGLGLAGGEGKVLLLRSCALAAALVAGRAAGQDGRQLLLALAGDAGDAHDAHDALLRRRLGC